VKLQIEIRPGMVKIQVLMAACRVTGSLVESTTEISFELEIDGWDSL
jgi:hypothetical protein